MCKFWRTMTNYQIFCHVYYCDNIYIPGPIIEQYLYVNVYFHVKRSVIGVREIAS